MGRNKYKMAAFKLVMLTLLFSVTLVLTSFGQKRVWKDDSTAMVKADTSLIMIDNKYYQKVITVTYKEVTADSFDEKVEELKRQKEELKARFEIEREQYQKQLEQLNKQLEAERIFVQTTKQQMKWLDKEEKERLNPKKSETDIQNERRQDFFKTKPKKQ